MSVVGCSPTTRLQPRAPQELKLELSVPDASVPPTGVKTITHTHTLQAPLGVCAEVV